MTTLDNPEEIFKLISIRGRLAYGIFCLEQAFKESNKENELSSKIIKILWEFTTSENLSEWEEEITDYEPIYVNDDSFIGYETLTNDQVLELKGFYKNLPYNIIQLIENSIDIGMSNLYSGTGEFSPSSLEPTMKVFKTAQLSLSKKPNPEAFLISKYTEFHGWGNNINRQDFLKNVW